MEKGIPVDDQTMDETYAVPTVVVNRFVVSTNPTTFRVVFGESRDIGSRINWRVGVSMSPFEAYELRGVLDKLLEPFKDNLDAVISDVQAARTKRDGD